MYWACNSIYICGTAPWGPVEGSNGQLSLNFSYKVIFKDFYTPLVSVLKNKRYTTYQTGFLFCRLGHAQEVGRNWGCLGSKTFSEHGHVHIKFKGIVSRA